MTDLPEADVSDLRLTEALIANPVHERMEINLPEALLSCTIRNINGVTMLQTSNLARKQVNVAHLQAGLYLVQLESESGMYSFKMVKD